MTCTLIAIFATMIWPAKLMAVCHYMCPTLDVNKKYVNMYKPYGAYCPANIIVEK
tara:strand:+ start:2372 stop:2536 length:165 start_codon:yes stop_codon:yes gene_type:complete